MFIISWFARHFYRRHVGDIPVEEIPETPSEAGSTLTRQRAGQIRDTDRMTYGSTTQSHQNASLDEVPSVSSHVEPCRSTDESVKNQLEDIFGPGITEAEGPLSAVKADIMNEWPDHNKPSGEGKDNKLRNEDSHKVTLDDSDIKVSVVDDSGNETFT